MQFVCGVASVALVSTAQFLITLSGDFWLELSAYVAISPIYQMVSAVVGGDPKASAHQAQNLLCNSCNSAAFSSALWHHRCLKPFLRVKLTRTTQTRNCRRSMGDALRLARS
jgi:hypothetical protein